MRNRQNQVFARKSVKKCILGMKFEAGRCNLIRGFQQKLSISFMLLDMLWPDTDAAFYGWQVLLGLLLGMLWPDTDAEVYSWQVLLGLLLGICLLYTSPSPRDRTRSRMPSSA